MKPIIFTGSAVALITPFTADKRAVDIPFFETLCEDQITRGTDALVICGTTGESPVLSDAERGSLFQAAVLTSAGRIPVIAGTGSNSTEKAVKQSNDAEKQGVNAILAVTPYYNKCTQEGLIKHYYYIADRISVPMIVYNVPSRTGLNILPETYKALSEHKNIAAVKEANGDISSVAKTRRLCADDLTVYSGNDDQTAALNALGGKGVISVAANIIPEHMHKLAVETNRDKAAALQLKALGLMNALFCEVNPIPVKKAMEYVWNKPLPLRMPLTTLSAKKEDLLKQAMINFSLL